MYHIYPKYSDRQSSVDPDQMTQNVASDQGPQCLTLIQQFLNTSTGRKMDLLKNVRTSMVESR